MQVKAKFLVIKSAELGYGGQRQEITNAANKGYESTGIPIREITLSAVCSDGNPEHESFAQYTPNGTATFTLNNPNLKDEFKPGEYYYLTFERAV